MSLKELINNQTIAFDIHRAGDRQEVGIKELHMHKRMNGKSFEGVQVKFYIDGSDKVEFFPKDTKNIQRIKLLNEIKRVLNKEKKKRSELVECIVGEVERYGASLSARKKVETMIKGAEKIAELFSKNAKIKKEIITKFKDQIQIVITRHFKEGEADFFIKQDPENHRIIISDSLKEVEKNI